MADRRKAPFTQADIVRVLKAARQADVPLRGFEVDRAGKIVVLIGEPQEPGAPVNPWDEVLTR